MMLLLILALGCSGNSTGGMFSSMNEDGPEDPGGGNVSNPILIPESKVDPEYPEAARVARVEGNVVLQCTISEVGVVSDVQVLRAEPAGWGFETASIDAVQQWRYEPALQNGVPLEVFFTVIVEFTIHN